MPIPAKTPFQQAMETADRLGLYDLAPELTIMAKEAGQTVGSLAEKIRALYVAKVQAYTTLLTTSGFLPGPPAIISNGLFTLGSVNGVPFRLTPAELLRHVLVAGPSGAGKTTILQPLALQFRAGGGHVIAADFKNDLSWLAPRDEDFIILHPDVPLNILDHPDYVQRSDYINMLITILTRSYYGGEHLRQVAHETLWDAYRRYEHPSINDWYETTKSRVSPKDTYQRRDAYNGLLMRLTRIIEQLPGMARTKIGIPHTTLWEHSLYLGALHQNDTTEFVTAWTVHSYYLYARTHQARNTLRYLVLLDEGLLTFGEGNRIDGPVLLPLVPLLREYGAALAIATAHLGAIHETIRANAYTTIILPLANATDASIAGRTLGLDAASANHLLDLQPGQAVVKTGKWRSPLLMEFPPLPYEKTVTAQEWQEAIERTNRLAPPTTPTINAPDQTGAIPEPTETDEPPTNLVRLSLAEERLLRTIAKETITTVSQAYEAANLPPQVGDRASKKTEALGYLNRTSIVASPGKGGTGVGLQLTDAGYERLNLKPSHLTRGGDSAQHLYLVVNISKHLHDPMIETTLGEHGKGGKSIDILFRLTPENARLLNVMGKTFHTLTPDAANITSEDLFAIEVETTHTNATSNATKNLTVGVAFNITAAMPKAVEATKRALLKALPTDALPRVVVADALELLQALREATA